MASRLTVWGSGAVVMCCVLGCVTDVAEVSAEAVGSPASILKKGQWAMGLGGGGLLSRALKGGAETTLYQLGHFRGYGLTDRLSLYGKVGGAYLEVDDASIKKVNDPSSIHRFGAAVLLAAQLKGKIWQHPKTGWEWDGSVQYVDIRARHSGDNDGSWHEWQLGTSLAKAIGRFKPYAGVKLSLVDFDFKIRQNAALLQQGSYEPEGVVEPFFGTDVYLGELEDTVMNVEFSYTDGAELTVAIVSTF
jgi:hypothetical protein